MPSPAMVAATTTPTPPTGAVGPRSCAPMTSAGGSTRPPARTTGPTRSARSPRCCPRPASSRCTAATSPTAVTCSAPRPDSGANPTCHTGAACASLMHVTVPATPVTRVAVAGGTGLLGRLVVQKLRARGLEPVVLARSVGVDVTVAAGLAEALRGAAAVIDATNVTTTSRKKAVAFFSAATKTLLDAGVRASVQHHVAVSIVGCDRIDLGYYFGKRRQEELVLAGAVPGTVLRATQFHEFADQLLERVPGPFAFAPRMRTQTVAAAEVADELLRLAIGEPVGRAPELAGPEVLEMSDLVRQVLRARRSRRVAVTARIPGRAGKAMASGPLLPTADGPRGKQTFAEWLARSVRQHR